MRKTLTGTLMASGLAMPLAVQAEEHGGGDKGGRNSPHYLAERHALEGCDLPLDKVTGVLEDGASAAAGQ